MSNNFDISINDFENICRTCLSREDLKPLYEKCFLSTCLVDMLMSCTFVKFAEDDGLPMKLCANCINDTNQAFLFAKRCETTDTILRKCVKIKTELPNNTFQSQNYERLIETGEEIKQNEEEDDKIEYIEDVEQDENWKIEYLKDNEQKDEVKIEYVDVKQEEGVKIEYVENIKQEDDIKIEYVDVKQNDAKIENEYIHTYDDPAGTPMQEENWKHSPNDDLAKAASAVTLNLLPPKSRSRYEKAYKQFLNWCEEKKAANYTENVLLAYFAEKIKGYKSSTLWLLYSMIKATLIAKNNIDISKYVKLIALLKRTTAGYRTKKSSTFSRDQIEKFLCDAPDKKYLMMKVCTIFGVAGACLRDELTRLTIDDIEDVGSALLVKIPDTKTKRPRNFTVMNKKINDISLLDFYRKYAALRPLHTEHRRFFVFFNTITQRCSTQVIGINTIGKIPTEIATFLELANPRSYTGHCFRRSSATLLADAGADITTIKGHGGWKSTAVAEGYIQDSEQNKQKIAKQIIIGEVGTSTNLIDTSSSSTNAMCSAQTILNFNNNTNCDIHVIINK